LTTVHIKPIFCLAKLTELSLIPIPLICNNVSTAHAPDRDNHFRDFFWLPPRNQILVITNLKVPAAFVTLIKEGTVSQETNVVGLKSKRTQLWA